MACVAFDLDSTLGFFGVVNPLAYLWSVDHLMNPEQLRVNSPKKMSSMLLRQLEDAKRIFADKLLKDDELLATVIRPNIDALLTPLLEARRSKHLKTIIIYSNTSVSYSVELAKYLLEQLFQTNIFSLEADHWHPLRDADHVHEKKNEYVEPLKTIETLQKLFKKALHQKKTVPLNNILFVDDRLPKHTLQEQEQEGLTYIVPTAFSSPVTMKQKNRIFRLAQLALYESGLSQNREYLASGFCNRNIPYDYTKDIPLKGLNELVGFVAHSMKDVKGFEWRPDTAALTRKVHKFLNQVKP